MLYLILTIPSSHYWDEITTDFLLEKKVMDFSTISSSMHLFKMLFNDSKTEIYNFWIRWVSFSGRRTIIIFISTALATIYWDYWLPYPSHTNTIGLFIHIGILCLEFRENLINTKAFTNPLGDVVIVTLGTQHWYMIVLFNW